MASLFKKPALKKGHKIELYDQQYSSIKDQLRKKNRANAKAEAIVMEWYVIISVGLYFLDSNFQNK